TICSGFMIVWAPRSRAIVSAAIASSHIEGFSTFEVPDARSAAATVLIMALFEGGATTDPLIREVHIVFMTDPFCNLLRFLSICPHNQVRCLGIAVTPAFKES